MWMHLFRYINLRPLRLLFLVDVLICSLQMKFLGPGCGHFMLSDIGTWLLWPGYIHPWVFKQQVGRRSCEYLVKSWTSSHCDYTKAGQRGGKEVGTQLFLQCVALTFRGFTPVWLFLPRYFLGLKIFQYSLGQLGISFLTQQCSWVITGTHPWCERLSRNLESGRENWKRLPSPPLMKRWGVN